MFRILAAAILLASATAAPAAATDALPVQQTQQQPIITLKDGTRLRFLRGMEANPDGKPEEREIVGVFQFDDATRFDDHAKMLAVADDLFGGIVLVAAEMRGYKRAAVGLLPALAAPGAGEKTEQIHYARRNDTVWLRQAGPESWKTAQNPNEWTAPKPEIVDLGEYGKVEVPFAGEIAAPTGRRKALGVEMYTRTPARTGRKIEEIRAMWQWLDPAKVKAQGYDTVVIQNYDERARGKFHARQMAFVALVMLANGEWPKLPEGPLGPDGKPLVTAENVGRSTFDLAIAALGGGSATVAGSTDEPAGGISAGVGQGSRPLSAAMPIAPFGRDAP